MNIHFFVLNMNKNIDRWQSISKMLDNLPISYSRIEAIDGFKMEKNKEVMKLLECRTNLLNKTFYCKTFQQEWKYDGSIVNSFPGLNIMGHEGAKGLILSNIKAFKECLKINLEYIYGINDDDKINLDSYQNIFKDTFFKYDWYCILEDDVIINIDIYNMIIKFIEENINNDLDIILLDKRVGGGAAGVIYNSYIISQILHDLHPLSEFSISMEEKYNHATLWDWKLWHYINNNEINYSLLPCIESGGFESTINI